MKKIELADKSVVELKEMIINIRKEQFNIRFQMSAGNLENVAKIKFLRRDIARIKTQLNSKNVN